MENAENIMKNVFEAQYAIVTNSALSIKAKIVMCYLIERNSKKKRNTLICFTSLKTIAADCGISVSSVQRAIRELVAEGLIKKNARFSKKYGGQLPNSYRINRIV